jgi:DNA-binding XRE family transcriptional regulator
MSSRRHLLVAHRKRVNFTQDDLSKYLGVGIRTINLWESGSKYPSLPNAVALAIALDITLADLVQSLGIATAGLKK